MVARIAELEAAGAGGVDAAPLDELRRRLAAAESAITDLRRAPPVEVAAAAEVAAAEARLNRALRAAEDRIAELETAMAAATAGGAGARGAVVLAVGQLQSRLRTSGEFTAALAAARAVAGDVADPELHALLADLQPHAGGVATLDELARSFAAIAGAVAVTEDAGEGWVAELWGRVRGAVSIRRTGEVPGDDPEARVARAEARLQQHDLAAAVAELDGLEIEAPELAPWLADARARLAADSVVERLGARALAVVAGSGAP